MMTSFEDARSDVVWQMFVRTADENYISARGCFRRGLAFDYHWLAVHSLEKYMKGVLLLNGRSSKGYGHEIVKLFREVVKIGGELVLDRLDAPDQWQRHWHSEMVSDYLERLYRNGNPHNRYDEGGYSALPEDLLKLDRVAFAVRRLCVDLDSSCRFGSARDWKAHLRGNPSEWRMGPGTLEELANAAEPRGARYVEFFNWNLSFAPPDFNHEPNPPTLGSSNPSLYLRVFDPVKNGDEVQVQVAKRVARWALKNLILSKETEQRLRDVC